MKYPLFTLASGLLALSLCLTKAAHAQAHYSVAVSGGAGARWYEIPRQPDDFYQDSGPTYHYCLLTSDKGRLDFSMMKLEMKGDRATFAKRQFTKTSSAAR